MRNVQVSKFLRLSGLDFDEEKEVLRITSRRERPVGYFVPVTVWEIFRYVIIGAKWDDLDELAAEALAIVGEGDDGT